MRPTAAIIVARSRILEAVGRPSRWEFVPERSTLSAMPPARHLLLVREAALVQLVAKRNVGDERAALERGVPPRREFATHAALRAWRRARQHRVVHVIQKHAAWLRSVAAVTGPIGLRIVASLPRRIEGKRPAAPVAAARLGAVLSRCHIVKKSVLRLLATRWAEPIVAGRVHDERSGALRVRLPGTAPVRHACPILRRGRRCGRRRCPSVLLLIILLLLKR